MGREFSGFLHYNSQLGMVALEPCFDVAPYTRSEPRMRKDPWPQEREYKKVGFLLWSIWCINQPWIFENSEFYSVVDTTAFFKNLVPQKRFDTSVHSSTMLGLKSLVAALFAAACALPLVVAAPPPTRTFTVRAYASPSPIGVGLTGYYLVAKNGKFFIQQNPPSPKPTLYVTHIGEAYLVSRHACSTPLLCSPPQHILTQSVVSRSRPFAINPPLTTTQLDHGRPNLHRHRRRLARVLLILFLLASRRQHRQLPTPRHRQRRHLTRQRRPKHGATSPGELQLDRFRQPRLFCVQHHPPAFQVDQRE